MLLNLLGLGFRVAKTDVFRGFLADVDVWYARGGGEKLIVVTLAFVIFLAIGFYMRRHNSHSKLIRS